MKPSFGELRLESGDHVVVEMSMSGFFFKVAFKRWPDGTVSDPIITGVGRPNDTLLDNAKHEAREFKKNNVDAIDAMLPK